MYGSGTFNLLFIAIDRSITCPKALQPIAKLPPSVHYLTSQLIEDEATHITTNQRKVEFWILNEGFEASNTLLQKLLHYQSHEAGHLKGATLIQKFATQLLFYLDKLKKNLSNKAIQLD